MEFLRASTQVPSEYRSKSFLLLF